MSASLVYHTAETMSGGVSPFDAAVMDMVVGQELLIACPYLGLDYLRRMTRPAAGWRLLTDVGEWLASHAADPRRRVVECVLANADRVRHCAGLHAKVLVAGGKALVGSANFTEKGITERVEMSVTFDGGRQVEALRVWFESLWKQTGPVKEADLRAWLAATPPRASFGPPPLPSLYPGVSSTLAPRAGSFHPEIEALLAGVSPSVRQLVDRLRDVLEDDGAEVKTTGTAGGDIRHYYTRVNFSEIRLQQAAVLLRLRIGKGSVADPSLRWNNGDYDSPDIGRVRLPDNLPIPGKVIDWIARAKAFTRRRHG